VPVSLWARAFTQLESELSEKSFNTYIRPLQAVGSGTTLRLLAPNRYCVEWVTAEALERIRMLVCANGRCTDVVVEVGSRVSEPAHERATTRRTANQLPRTTPYRSTAVCAYCEQLG